MRLNLNAFYIAPIMLVTLVINNYAFADRLSNSRSDSTFRSVYIAPEVSYVLPTEKEVNSTVFVGGRLGYQLDPNWALEVESGWMRFGVDATVNKDLDITTVPVLANVRYGQRATHEQPGWYTFAGVGWAYNDIDQNEDQAELEDATLWQVGVGGEMSISDSTIGFIDVRYLGNSSDIKQADEVPAGVGNYADLNAVLFTAGVKF